MISAVSFAIIDKAANGRMNFWRLGVADGAVRPKVKSLFISPRYYDFAAMATGAGKAITHIT